MDISFRTNHVGAFLINALAPLYAAPAAARIRMKPVAAPPTCIQAPRVDGVSSSSDDGGTPGRRRLAFGRRRHSRARCRASRTTEQGASGKGFWAAATATSCLIFESLWHPGGN